MGLKVMLVGKGARESALGWKIQQSPLVEQFVCTPGNGGFAPEKRRDIKDTNTAGIVEFAKSWTADLVVIGPEAPLALGVVDALGEVGIKAFGPSRRAAMLEVSKIFTKRMCLEVDIPTARATWTDNLYNAGQIIDSWESVPVVKADGLCGGKGVVVSKTLQEAFAAARDMLGQKPPYGTAGSRILIEDRLIGRECSIMALCDGENAVLLPAARDYKCLLDGDEGPNTGGMGAYSPVLDLDDAILEKIKARIIEPTLRFMLKRGMPFHGLLYAGLMLTAKGPYLLEYNVRFGNPETQVVLPRIESDIVPYLLATLEPSGLAKLPPLQISSKAAVCTNLVSEGYPGKYETGFRIENLDAAEDWATIFHAGTDGTPNLVTTGGRVMSCVGLADDLGQARMRSCQAANLVKFPNKFYRGDIAADQLPRV